MKHIRPRFFCRLRVVVEVVLHNSLLSVAVVLRSALLLVVAVLRNYLLLAVCSMVCLRRSLLSVLRLHPSVLMKMSRLLYVLRLILILNGLRRYVLRRNCLLRFFPSIIPPHKNSNYPRLCCCFLIIHNKSDSSYILSQQSIICKSFIHAN